MFITDNLPTLAGLPLHVNELKDIEPQLSSLVAVYKIDAVSFLIVFYADIFSYVPCYFLAFFFS